MTSPTKKITTPISKRQIELRDWITGEEAEYIDEAIMSAVDVKPDIANKTASIGKFRTEAINEQIHREIEKFVFSVDGEIKNVLKDILSLPEEDYEFVKNEITIRRSKKKV